MAVAQQADAVRQPLAIRAAAATAAIAGCLGVAGSLFLPWGTVTRRLVPLSNLGGDTTVSSWTAYPLTSVTNLLVPLLLLPAVALVVSLVRTGRRGTAPTGDALALALLGVVATVIYAFLLAVASVLSAGFGFVPGHTSVVALAPTAGFWLALAGSLLALAGVVATRTLTRLRAQHR
jgi:hypothetical protein